MLHNRAIIVLMLDIGSLSIPINSPMCVSMAAMHFSISSFSLLLSIGKRDGQLEESGQLALLVWRFVSLDI